VCLCYVENPNPAQIHYAVRRLRRRTPGALILVALLGAMTTIDENEVVQTSAHIDLVKSSLGATI